MAEDPSRRIWHPVRGGRGCCSRADFFGCLRCDKVSGSVERAGMSKEQLVETTKRRVWRSDIGVSERLGAYRLYGQLRSRQILGANNATVTAFTIMASIMRRLLSPLQGACLGFRWDCPPRHMIAWAILGLVERHDESRRRSYWSLLSYTTPG